MAMFAVNDQNNTMLRSHNILSCWAGVNKNYLGFYSVFLFNGSVLAFTIYYTHLVHTLLWHFLLWHSIFFRLMSAINQRKQIFHLDIPYGIKKKDIVFLLIPNHDEIILWTLYSKICVFPNKLSQIKIFIWDFINSFWVLFSISFYLFKRQL